MLRTRAGGRGGTNTSQITVNTGGLFGGGVSAIQATDTQGSASNSEVQTVTLANATGGTFRLTFGTEQTADLAYNASAGTVETALDGLAGIDNVTVTGSAGGPYTITFGGTQANTNVGQISADVTFLTSGTVDRTLSYAYDAASQLTSTSDPSADYDYTYDNLGRLTAEVQDIAGLTPDIEFAHTWNANSMRTSLASEIGGTADFKNDYSYDNLSRMTQVIQRDVGGGNVVADKRVDFAYNALGQFSSLTRYQNTGTSNLVASTTFAYDTLNRLTDLDHKQNSTNLALYDYTYDAMDRLTSITSSIDGASSFTYDKESQLTAADHASPIADESFSYDATGNRNGGSYTTTTNNRTTADGTYTYQYDDEGNRTRRTKNSDSSYEEYSWDYRNRLTKVTFKNSGGTILKTVEYSYDTNNRLVRRAYDADGPGGSSAADQLWAFDGQSINPVLQFDGAAASDLTNRYVWGPNVDQILASEDVTSLGSAGNVLWALTDHLGTVRDIADLDEGSGATTVTNHRFYDSYGNLKSETNSAVDSIFGFTGKLFDEITKQQNNWNRWYDPLMGQWLTEDPLGLSADVSNLRRYVHNGATYYIDPNGLWEMPFEEYMPPWWLCPAPHILEVIVDYGWSQGDTIGTGASNAILDEMSIALYDRRQQEMVQDLSDPDSIVPWLNPLAEPLDPIATGERYDIYMDGLTLAGTNAANQYAAVVAAHQLAIDSATIVHAGIGVQALASAPNLVRAAPSRVLTGTGAFLEGSQGGQGLGLLANRPISVTEKGLSIVEQHLAQFGPYEPNAAMIERLQGAMQSGSKITGADASFYMHELNEATMMGRGVSYEAAHTAALQRYGVSPYSVYHPEVIAANPEQFNVNWINFWSTQ